MSGGRQRKPEDKVSALRNWALISAVAIAFGAIGCGGSGGGSAASGGGGGGGGPVPGSGPQVMLTNDPGGLEFSFFTGQGRSTFAPGDSQARVALPDLTDTLGNTVIPPADARVNLLLNGYQNSIVRLNAPVATEVDQQTGRALSSRSFQAFSLLVNSVRREEFDGSIIETNSVLGLPTTPLPVNVRAFSGRYSSLSIFLNSAMFPVVTDPFGSQTIGFDQAAFESANGLDVQPRINSFISDHLAFDISGMPAGDRPTLASGRSAYRVFFSGDLYALGSGQGMAGVPGADQTREFNGLTRFNLDPTDPSFNLIEGLFALPGQLSVIPGVSGTTPGTYSLVQIDPSDPFLLARVTALQGIWREHHKMISNMPEAMAIAFPSSRDQEEQEVLVFRQEITRLGSSVTRAQVTQMYYGVQNLSTGLVRLYPIRNLTTGSRNGEVTAQVINLLDRSGAPTAASQRVRSGEITGLSIPGIPASVPMVVYRY